MTKDFMARTIKAHNLFVANLATVSNLVSERLNVWEMAETHFFERRDIIIRDFVSGTVDKSFEKWLAIQKHDVKAVNSLYEWRQATRRAEMAVEDDIDDLEQMTLSPALQIHVDNLLARKHSELKRLNALHSDLSDAIDTVKATAYVRKSA